MVRALVHSVRMGLRGIRKMLATHYHMPANTMNMVSNWISPLPAGQRNLVLCGGAAVPCCLWKVWHGTSFRSRYPDDPASLIFQPWHCINARTTLARETRRRLLEAGLEAQDGDCWSILLYVRQLGWALMGRKLGNWGYGWSSSILLLFPTDSDLALLPFSELLPAILCIASPFLLQQHRSAAPIERWLRQLLRCRGRSRRDCLVHSAGVRLRLGYVKENIMMVLSSFFLLQTKIEFRMEKKTKLP